MRIEEIKSTVRLHDMSMTADIVQGAIRVLQHEAHAILECAERLKQCEESAEFRRAISMLLRSLELSGKIVVAGIGKSGRVGEKLAATLQSTGSCAVFMHPVEGLHGDLGVIQPNDVLIAISHSGKTDELLRIMPSLKLRGIPVIAMCGDRHSPLVKESDAWVDCNVKSEAEPRIPAPTTSTTVALAVGDAIAVTLMQLRAFTPQLFALNHPGGALGRRLLLKVKDVMHRAADVPTVAENASMAEVINKANASSKSNAVLVIGEDYNVSMTSTKTAVAASDSSNASGAIHSVGATPALPALRSCLPLPPPLPSPSPSSSTAGVSRAKMKLIGIITQGDIRRSLTFNSEQFFELVATDVMTADPITCAPDDIIADVKQVMEDREISVLPVLDKSSRLTGLVTLRDLAELI